MNSSPRRTPNFAAAQSGRAGDFAVNGRGAFTLIELLLAVVIFAVVLLSIHYVFYGAIKLRNKATQSLEAALPLQQALAILRRDLTHLVLPGGTLSGPLETSPTSGQQPMTGLSGRTVSPEFYTASGVVDDTLPWSEVQKVSYLLSPPTNQSVGLDLYRSVTRNLLPVLTQDSEAQWLLGGVEDMAFQYYNGTQWKDTWEASSGTTNLPCAIKVQIQFVAEENQRRRPAPIQMVVPVMVQAATNQTEQTTGGGA